MNILMPQLGETVEEGTVGQWFKAPGDPVARNETLLEVDTDKTTAEVPALAAGTLVEILVQEGETVPVGTVLAVMESADAPASPQPARGGARKISPVVRRLLAEHGLRIEDIPGTGAEGRVTRKDVLAHLEARSAETPSAAPCSHRTARAVQQGAPQHGRAHGPLQGHQPPRPAGGRGGLLRRRRGAPGARRGLEVGGGILAHPAPLRRPRRLPGPRRLSAAQC